MQDCFPSLSLRYGTGKKVYIKLTPPHSGPAIKSVTPVIFDYIGPKLTGVTVTQAKSDTSKVKLTLAGSNFCKAGPGVYRSPHVTRMWPKTPA